MTRKGAISRATALPARRMVIAIGKKSNMAAWNPPKIPLNAGLDPPVEIRYKKTVNKNRPSNV
jgi:hypothetical protein